MRLDEKSHSARRIAGLLVQSKLWTNKRFVRVSAAVIFACFVVFYACPILPFTFFPKNTSITPDDITFVSSHKEISLSEKNSLCAAHKVQPYHGNSFQQLPGRRKVYDLFVLNTELDWLEIRLHELASQVDYFVILESPTTTTGLPKPMYFQENKEKFRDFEDKIIHHVLELPEEGHPDHIDNGTLVVGTPEHEAYIRAMERFQRNAIFSQVLPFLNGDAHPNIDDVIIVSDVDEIPRPATVQLLRECRFSRITTLRSRFYNYSFQWLHQGGEWAHPQATTYRGKDNTILPASLRELDGSLVANPVLSSDQQTIWNSSWYCSSCFATVSEMQHKMKSLSKTKLDEEKFSKKERILEHIRNGKDLWDRRFQWYTRVDNNQDLPEYVKEQSKEGRFGYMIDRDGEGAGFEDYINKDF
jgi:beta-1,4-mannosyl-glycoprotein beta-1,4-N-acetylglucosaminyltransferase